MKLQEDIDKILTLNGESDWILIHKDDPKLKECYDECNDAFAKGE